MPACIYILGGYILRYRYHGKDDIIISDEDEIYWQFVDTQQQRLALLDEFGVRFGVVLLYDHPRPISTSFIYCEICFINCFVLNADVR